jgi:non-reducing end alpha-L-arabinofuranosidase
MRNLRFVFFCAAALAASLASDGCGGSDGGGSTGGGGGTSTPGASGSAGKGGSAISGSSGSGGGGGSSTGVSGSSGKGGSSAGAGSGGGSGVPNCPNGTSCGGDLVGTWQVSSSCLALSGDLNVEMGSLGCKTIPVVSSLQVTGTWTVKSDGSYKDATTTKGSMTFPLDPSCLSVSSVPVECGNMGAAFNTLGWNNTTCSETDGKCSCKAETNLVGGLGLPSIYSSDSGNYEASGGALKVDEQVEYSYCVEGSNLTLTPKPTILPVKGTIVLQKGVTPTGGTGGGSGSGGKGGTGGTGGGTSSGGKGGTTGGATASAGTTGGKGGTGGVVGGTTSSGGTPTGGSSAPGGASGSRPCDIYESASTPCVAAHSTIRALFSSYSGKLYQVRRASDKTFLDIGLLSAGGLADGAAQDTFCKSTTCVITKIYDQTKNGNFLGCQSKDMTLCPDAGSDQTGDSPASATNELLKVGGASVYSLRMNVGNAYWRDGSKSGMPLKDAPQGVYMVTSGVFFNGGCCFDYGNGPTTRKMSGGGTMDSVYFGNSTQWGSGNGSGPWVMADLEGGIFSQASIGKNTSVPSMPYSYVTAIEKNTGKGEFALRGADATTGKLSTFYKGKSPYGTMNKQGSIILGSGGDCCYSNSNGSKGVFYEGAIVAGYPDDATEDKLQENIISAGYGK